MKHYIILCLSVACFFAATAQKEDSIKNSTLDEVSISTRRAEGVSRLGGAENGQNLGLAELCRAACCNLGESFVTNPSVDVNYNDAAVGARQIKLLGLSGQYVQMLCEMLPTSVGASLPYSLGYVPGSWMKSISVSKGAASVKNGPQSITGQINVEYLKPDDEEGVSVNLYGDSRLKGEVNATANKHFTERFSGNLMVHYEHDFGHHDDDGDLWHDSPAVRQLHLMSRWKYVGDRYIMHAGAGYLQEEREGGQMLTVTNPYRVLIDSRRAEGYMKHAFILDRDHNTNIALAANAFVYQLDGTFGPKDYAVDQRSFNSQLMLEHDFSEDHLLSTGLNLNGDRYDETLLSNDYSLLTEYTPGAYVQYTYTPSYKFTLMGGLRVDHSTLYDRSYVTPRMHVKWVTGDHLTLRASVGKGYRTPHAMAEQHYLLASGRTLTAPAVLPQEEAWNSGLSATLYLHLWEKSVQVNAEYYYTDFLHQAVVDYDSDPTKITIADLNGKSYSHTLQLDASCDITDELNILAAFRYNHVRCTYGGVLMEKPLQSRYKGLVTVGWKPMMGIWQLDITLSLNGGGRMPTPYTLGDGSASWDKEFPAYPQLSAQLTREFRHFSVYIGGENLTGYRQPNPIINAATPWSADFEPTLVWGPVHGTMVYAGIRANL